MLLGAFHVEIMFCLGNVSLQSVHVGGDFPTTHA
jgi:hypothetical protein